MSFDLDCSDIPDLVPVLTVLGSFCEGKSYIRNAARLRIKECDRLSAISISVCKEAATLLINNSPCCQKRIFLFSNSTPNEEIPFVNASFRRKSTSSIRE